MSYTLLFTVEKMDPKDLTSDTILAPVIVNENGEKFAMQKAMRTVAQAFTFDAGFTLAQFIEAEGGFEGVRAVLHARDAGDPLAPTVEDGAPDADEGC